MSRVNDYFDIDKIEWKLKFGFNFFGSKIGIAVDLPGGDESFFKIVPQNSQKIRFTGSTERFYLRTTGDLAENGFYWYRDGALEQIYRFESFDENCLVGLEMKLMFTLALISPPRLFIFHAGAVSFAEEGILLPGNTFAGKTTLVAELIRNGADYLTDDCAFVDREGFLHPNTSPLAVRTHSERQYLTSENFCAVDATRPVKVKYILLTEYRRGALWNPMPVSDGRVCFQLMENLFYKPAVRRKPAETLEFMSKLSAQARTFESLRDEAREVVDWLKKLLGTG